MTMQFHYVVARESDTGTWYTVDMEPSMSGNAYDNKTDTWVYGGDVDPGFDEESFAQLSAALYALNAARKVTA